MINMRTGLVVAGTVCALLAGAPLPAQASVFNVSSILIQSALPDYIQVAELIATQTGTGTDVALASNGATTAGSGDYPGSSRDYAIDGLFPVDYPQIFHSAGSGSSEFLKVTFSTAADLSGITIYGRAGCCTNRDDYIVTLLNAHGDALFTGNIDGRGAGGGGTTLLVDAPRLDVPEPASMALLGASLLGLGLTRRRKV